ncbi:MAG: DUF499 domain-containing protein [Promethearchaeota archaeon]
MKPDTNWYEIVIPNSMIRSGQIKESWFVPDLSNVIHQSPPLEYSDPVMFFQKTYLTRGLVRLLNNIWTKLHNAEGSGIIKLQTPFGGGKTHALIAIYHYTTSGTKLTDFFSKNLSPIQSKVATIVGTNLNPLEGRKENNICIRTIWGDIAHQIAGTNGYNDFKANDENRITPGKEKMCKFLRKHEPFLILLDEIAEYIVKARAVSVNESNLGTQTLIFLQELTEAISSLSRGLLIITLPVHQYEDFSETPLDVVNRINQILGRLETTETPVDRDDIYQLIIKRLIDKVLLQEKRDEIISKYIQMYQKRRNLFPERVQDPSFIKRMKDSYPFHPEFIDILYDKWSSFTSFQGTRAILRILTRVLADLWSSKEELDLVQLMNVNFRETSIKNEFLRHVEPQFESIVGSDIIGLESKSVSLDKLHPEWNNLASGMSRTIFLSSFNQGENLRGITLSELKINIMKPQIPISLIKEILDKLNGSLHFLHNNDGRYYFCHEPNLNRQIQDLKELFQEDFEEELRLEINQHCGKELRTIIWPNSSRDIPDDNELKIVFVHPSTPRKSLRKWLDIRGNTFRRNKNTLIFAIPDKSHLKELKSLVQTKLALNELQERASKISEKRQYYIITEIIKQQKRIANALSFSIRKTYSQLYDGTHTISLGLPKAKYEPLTKWFKSELLAREYIVSKLHYRKLKELFLNINQWVSTQEVLLQFFINLNLFKIESVDTIKQAICWGVEEGAFAKATVRNNKIQNNLFFFSNKLTPAQVKFTSDEYLIVKEVATAITDYIRNNSQLKESIIPKDLKKALPSDFNILKTKIKPQEIFSLSLEVDELKSKSLPAFYRGVLKPLESRNANISIQLKLDIKCDKIIPETILETTIKETIRQLGAQITKIEKPE